MPRIAPGSGMLVCAASQSGRPAASEPAAADSAPIRLYRAKSAVRASPAAASARRDCSSGRNRLTSPALGLSVPTNATAMSAHSVDRLAKPMPVAAISAAASISIRRCATRPASMPTAIVASAEPSNVTVLTSPTSSCENPSASRYAGSSTAMNPSQKPRMPRLARTSAAVLSAPAGGIRPASEAEKRPLEACIAPAPRVERVIHHHAVPQLLEVVPEIAG
ncbi:hypothetical protein X942_4517 [Burkholderia pseudomallei MSHR5596]|nr:hypothetical protein X942_4517 [Burkholderia pseudomallei MSHR5596]